MKKVILFFLILFINYSVYSYDKIRIAYIGFTFEYRPLCYGIDDVFNSSFAVIVEKKTPIIGDFKSILNNLKKNNSQVSRDYRIGIYLENGNTIDSIGINSSGNIIFNKQIYNFDRDFFKAILFYLPCIKQKDIIDKFPVLKE